MLRSLPCVSSEVRLASVPASDREAHYPVRMASDDTGIVTESIGELKHKMYIDSLMIAANLVCPIQSASQYTFQTKQFKHKLIQD